MAAELAEAARIAGRGEYVQVHLDHRPALNDRRAASNSRCANLSELQAALAGGLAADSLWDLSSQQIQVHTPPIAARPMAHESLYSRAAIGCSGRGFTSAGGGVGERGGGDAP